ncbi:TetR/AcrR family transcriptional regulator [Phytohabitans rumicis]|uniref:DNA-binding transcriptional regulator n=1 Tax=Phytohabitans rumicis TaxID=1076125 RepID=A0A6V8KVV5_9ACTN|nr:TetR family transcriptional regulator [Phytohabitans rumicis]GFJ87964.1 DNA-binding transcriptional regulator [Phytohabitans rumicis]
MTGPRTQRRRDPEARKEALATAALEVIAEAGIGRTTHRAVAARADLPLGATTYYFPTLDDLIAAGLRRATEAVRADLRVWAERLATAPDLPAALARMSAAYLADRRRAQIEYELYVAAARDPVLRPLAREWLRGLRDVLEPHVGAAAARDVCALLDGAMLQALVTGGDLDEKALAEAIRRLTRGGAGCGGGTG